MKLKLDENLPESLLSELSRVGHDVDNVRGESLTGRDDMEVWKAAQETGRVLITQDLDFSDIRRFAPGTHHGLVLVRLRVPGNCFGASNSGSVRNRARGDVGAKFCASDGCKGACPFTEGIAVPAVKSVRIRGPSFSWFPYLKNPSRFQSFCAFLCPLRPFVLIREIRVSPDSRKFANNRMSPNAFRYIWNFWHAPHRAVKCREYEKPLISRRGVNVSATFYTLHSAFCIQKELTKSDQK